MPLVTSLRWALAAGLALNGLAMLAGPHAWYDLVPGVAYTGPLNLHFVRDIGCAYLVAGAGLAWRAGAGTAAAALPGVAFLLLHAGVHIGETLAGLCGWSALLRDVPTVIVPALAAAALARPARRSLPTPNQELP